MGRALVTGLLRPRPLLPGADSFSWTVVRPYGAELSMGWVDPRVVLGWVGSGMGRKFVFLVGWVGSWV